MTKRSHLTRRQFIHRLAAVGGTGAAFQALHAMGLLGVGAAQAAPMATTAALPKDSLKGKRVIVIGAGVAGLCAALRMMRAGAEVEVLEATTHIGGRNHTLRHGDKFREWDWNSDSEMVFEAVGDMKPDDEDLYLNAGPGRIPQHHTRVLDYCKMLNVELQPFIFFDAANLLQNDAWNGGRPIQMRQAKNDLRGHLAELLAKVKNQGKLDALISPTDADAFLGMLQHFGQLSAEGAELVYKGAALRDYARAGYRVQPDGVGTPGRAFPTLSLSDILESDFWNKEMFTNLEYAWQASLMQPVGGMDKIVQGFELALARMIDPSVTKLDQKARAALATVIKQNEPVTSIDIEADKLRVVSRSGERKTPDYVIPTLAPQLLAGLNGNFLPEGVRKVLNEIYVSPACKVGWQGRTRFWEDETRIYGGISWTKNIINQIWYPSYGFNSATGVLTGAYNRTEDATEFQDFSREQRLETALKAGEKLHPGFREKVFAENGVSIAWGKMPYQVGGWANETWIEQPDVFKEMASIGPVKGKMFIAGDWFSYWPGWQEGALDSAHVATDQLARHALGRG